MSEAIASEVAEKTGAEVDLVGFVGVDQNATHGVVSVCFSAIVEGGGIWARPPETLEARFVAPDEAEIPRLATRSHFRGRGTLRATKCTGPDSVSYNASKLRPYQRTSKFGSNAG